MLLKLLHFVYPMRYLAFTLIVLGFLFSAASWAGGGHFAPVLVLGARQDALVAWHAVEQAAERLPRGELVAWGPEARHELLREVDSVRGSVMAAMTGFLDRVVPAKAIRGA